MVDAADNRADAVAFVTQREYALILMDVQMLVLDGVEATRRIRQRPDRASVPILAMTANAFQGSRDACLNACMNDFIAKSVDSHALFEAL